MGFISLHDLMAELLEDIKRNESGEIMHKEYYYSEAAKLTRRHLRNKAHPIRWGVSDGRFEPDFIDSDKNAEKGMAILKHMEEWQEWKKSTRLELMEKYPNANNQWLDETINDMEYKRGWPYKGADYLRAMKVGFDRNEVAEFIERFKQQYAPKPVIELNANQQPEPASVKIENNKKDKKDKPIKRLIPNERETTELLILIYRMFKHFDIEVGAESSKLSAKEAWGYIHAGKFKCDLIKNKDGTRKTAYIELNGGDVIDEESFIRTFNRRFK